MIYKFKLLIIETGLFFIKSIYKYYLSLSQSLFFPYQQRERENTMKKIVTWFSITQYQCARHSHHSVSVMLTACDKWSDFHSCLRDNRSSQSVKWVPNGVFTHHMLLRIYFVDGVSLYCAQIDGWWQGMGATAMSWTRCCISRVLSSRLRFKDSRNFQCVVGGWEVIVIHLNESRSQGNT